ncbi:hypothetical protein CANARDRAFT_10173 [[Candida] arabinofermentans NRRL YB-2248]|uniref:Reverse transcriptase Ty1/copia-type domain-containing protein n=1 Tax=[Candida] arabinofermentans NRRL YB-2248 TaxID=983967 RepID=A0A1E4STS0_9ASCO|nr:hypothetical protein CANARDRAFT_10173 [[Candida] arabinofermentans NRRL YB-2248]
MDVTTAFLNGHLTEEIYMQPPPDFSSLFAPSQVFERSQTNNVFLKGVVLKSQQIMTLNALMFEAADNEKLHSSQNSHIWELMMDTNLSMCGLNIDEYFNTGEIVNPSIPADILSRDLIRKYIEKKGYALAVALFNACDCVPFPAILQAFKSLFSWPKDVASTSCNSMNLKRVIAKGLNNITSRYVRDTLVHAEIKSKIVVALISQSAGSVDRIKHEKKSDPVI